MTVALRAINAVMVPMAWSMPHLKVVMANLEGSQCEFSLDCFRFYWQLPLDEDSRDYFTIVPPSGLFTAKRVIMGPTESVAYQQQVVE